MAYRTSHGGGVRHSDSRQDTELATRELALGVIVRAGFNLDASHSPTDPTAIGQRSNAYVVAFARPLATGVDRERLDAAFALIDGKSLVVVPVAASAATPTAPTAHAPSEDREAAARRNMIAEGASRWTEAAPADDDQGGDE